MSEGMWDIHLRRLLMVFVAGFHVCLSFILSPGPLPLDGHGLDSPLTGKRGHTCDVPDRVRQPQM